MVGFLQNGDRQIAGHCREPFQKIFQGVAALQILEECLHRNPCSAEDWSALHGLRSRVIASRGCIVGAHGTYGAGCSVWRRFLIVPDLTIGDVREAVMEETIAGKAGLYLRRSVHFRNYSRDRRYRRVEDAAMERRKHPAGYWSRLDLRDAAVTQPTIGA